MVPVGESLGELMPATLIAFLYTAQNWIGKLFSTRQKQRQHLYDVNAVAGNGTVSKLQLLKVSILPHFRVSVLPFPKVSMLPASPTSLFYLGYEKFKKICLDIW